MNKFIPVLLTFILFISSVSKGQSVNLSGTWRFAIDRDDCGVEEKWFDKALKDSIKLPGSMPERFKGDIPDLKTQWTGSLYDSSFYFYPRLEKYRQPGNVKFPFFLTPNRHYVGVAWYQRDIVIPQEWKDKHVTLYLERPHIETRLWIDGKEAGMQNSLSVPHRFIIENIKPGKHVISVRVDNRLKEINVGRNAHSVTDQTQGNWNGITGEIKLLARDRVCIDDIQVYPDIKGKSVTILIAVKNLKNGTLKGNITLSAESFNSTEKHNVPYVSIPFTVNNSIDTIKAVLSMGDKFLKWDEFTPALYNLNVKLSSGQYVSERKIQFGMREFSIKGRYFYVNGNKTVLRGTVENCLFPLTGYPPTDVDSWKKVFAVCKAHGLNHVRYHSFCPPEAAFIAADLMGIYMQPEGPAWPNHSTNLGDGRPSDKFIMDETIAMVKEYGNYASFCMLALGNEPTGRHWVRWAGEFVDFWKSRDNRRVYTGASVGGSWAWQPKSQFHVKAGARGLSWGRMPESYSIYTQIDTVSVPFVSHETGQWCAFPNLEEIKKYTGVNKAKNFELFKEDLYDHDMGEMEHEFFMASGKLQAICYKHEIEKTLRTPEYAGFQLLSLNDYSGQGTALVGVTDAFWDTKGYISPDEFRRFCNSTVVLAKMRKFVYKGSEVMAAEIETSHFGREPLFDANVIWTIKNEFGEILAEGVFNTKEIPVGNNNIIGKIEFPLNSISKACKLNLEAGIKNTEYFNDWDFWVYPELPSVNSGNVYIADTLDAKALDILKNGGNLLLIADKKISYGKSIVQELAPVFWNTSWFKMRPPHTTGIFVNPSHPIFNKFPTDYHADLQWWELVQRAQVMLLSDFPAGFQPVIQPIDTWFHNRKIGLLFEANSGGGKIIVTSADLRNDLGNRVVARQLLESILDYMNSDKFNPEYKVNISAIQDLFTKTEPPLGTYTTDMPDELRVQ